MVVLQLPKLAMRVRFPLPALLVFLLAGCASLNDQLEALQAPATVAPQDGTVHPVQSGETLWRIARSFGVETDALAAANGIKPSRHLEAGQTLVVPLPPPSEGFVWPVRGHVYEDTAATGLAIQAPPGVQVRASRGGLVALAAHSLVGWKGTVIVDHQDGLYTVYAGLETLGVQPGQLIQKGQAVGSLGSRPLHFEIRQGTAALDILSQLPEA